MAHHAYFVAGEIEEGILSARAFLEEKLDLQATGNADVLTLRFGLLSVDDARSLRSLADLAPVNGSQKALIVTATRLFHEAQNALLKLFEEPPEGTTLILILPAEGMLLPTLRSRLLPIPQKHTARAVLSEVTNKFIKSSNAEREKLVEAILTRAKSDKDTEKQAARLSAIQLTEGLMQAGHTEWQTATTPAKKKDLQAFLDDLDHFMPILHERSAPLKLIFEHILITMPALAK